MSSLRVTFAALLACASLTASAWWETTITTNKWEYDGVEYLESSGTQYIKTGMFPFGLTSYSFSFDIAFTSFYNYNSVWGSSYDADTYESWVYSSGSLAARTNGARPSDTTLSVNTRYALSYYRANGYFGYSVNGSAKSASTSGGSSTAQLYLGLSGSDYGKAKIYSFDAIIGETYHLLPVLHEGEGKMLDLVHNTLYANAGTGAFTYGSVTGTVTYTQITTNRVYHANPPQTAYDAASPWNAPERTRLGGDARTLRPSAIIKEN